MVKKLFCSLGGIILAVFSITTFADPTPVSEVYIDAIVNHSTMTLNSKSEGDGLQINPGTQTHPLTFHFPNREFAYSMTLWKKDSSKTVCATIDINNFNTPYVQAAVYGCPLVSTVQTVSNGHYLIVLNSK